MPISTFRANVVSALQICYVFSQGYFFHSYHLLFKFLLSFEFLFFLFFPVAIICLARPSRVRPFKSCGLSAWKWTAAIISCQGCCQYVEHATYMLHTIHTPRMIYHLILYISCDVILKGCLIHLSNFWVPSCCLKSFMLCFLNIIFSFCGRSRNRVLMFLFRFFLTALGTLRPGTIDFGFLILDNCNFDF